MSKKLKVDKDTLQRKFTEIFEEWSYVAVLNKFLKEGARVEIEGEKDEDGDHIWICRLMLGKRKVGFFRYYNMDTAIRAALYKASQQNDMNCIPWVKEEED